MRFEVIMTLVFFRNLRLKCGCLFKFENNQFKLVAIRPYSLKNTKSFGNFVYLHSRSQRFFVDVSFKFSNDHCRCSAYGNFAILLSVMQLLTGYLLTPKDLDFRRFFAH